MFSKRAAADTENKTRRFWGKYESNAANRGRGGGGSFDASFPVFAQSFYRLCHYLHWPGSISFANKWIHRLQVSGCPCVKKKRTMKGTGQTRRQLSRHCLFCMSNTGDLFQPLSWSRVKVEVVVVVGGGPGVSGFYLCLAARSLHLIRRLITRRPNILRKKKQHGRVHKQSHVFRFKGAGVRQMQTQPLLKRPRGGVVQNATIF